MDVVNQAGILDFESIRQFFDGYLPESLDWLAFALAAFALSFIVINALIAVGAVYTWYERRAIGRFQNRLGPNRWGPFGLLQPIADVVKLMTKEDTRPASADRVVFILAPVAFLVPVLVVFAIIPFGEDSFLGKLNVGILFIVAVTAINTIGLLMAGWSSRNKYAILGTMRGVAMLVSYEVPMALALTGVVLMAGSLSLFEIVDQQDLPFLLVQPLGFLVFMAAASAEMSRAPFDMIESESELGGGYNTEYSGMKFGIFQLAEFLAPLATSTIAAVLFLGGTRGFAPIPGQGWLLLKVFILVSVLLWLKSTWPRLRVDQIMGFAWKGLFPLGLLNMFLIAVEVHLLQDPVTGELSTGQLWTMAAINWGVTIVSIVVIANVLGQHRIRRIRPVASSLANMYAEAD